MMFVRVEITTPGHPAKKASLDGPLVILGRDPACQLPFDGKTNSAVSWQHARIDVAAGGATIADLGSSNGTFVNDERVGDKRTIRVGDVISLGQTGPKVRVVEIATAPPPPVHQTVAEKMLPQGMLTPPSGHAPLNVSVDTSGSRPGLKRKRSPLGGIVLGLLALGAVAAAGFIVFDSRPKTEEKKDDGEPKDKKSPETKDEKESPSKPPVETVKNEPPPGVPQPPILKLPVNPSDVPKAPPPPVLPPTTHTAAEVYQRALQSTGWVTVPRSPTTMSTGSGVLVDVDNRLFLTAYHVVALAPEARIYFPRTDEDPDTKVKSTKSDRKHYLDNERPVIGEIILADPKRDLAVLRLRSVPANVLPLPLAPKSIEIAHRVHTVGNAAVSGALWSHTEGSVRQIAFKKLKLDGKQDVEAWMVEAQFPINPGDSGGAVVNDRCELVGVNSSFNAAANSMSNVIDLREVLLVLDQARRIPTLKLGP